MRWHGYYRVPFLIEATLFLGLSPADQIMNTKYYYYSARLKNGMRVSHHHCPVVGQRRISSYVWSMHVRILPGSMTVCRPWFSPCSFFPCSLRDHVSNGTRRSSLFRPKGQRHVGQRVGVEVGHLKYADFDLENLRLVRNFLTG